MRELGWSLLVVALAAAGCDDGAGGDGAPTTFGDGADAAAQAPDDETPDAQAPDDETTPDAGGRPDAAPPPEEEPAGLRVLGDGEHTLDAVVVRTIGIAADGLATPRDLAFNPEAQTQLWVVNNADSSVTVFFDVGTDAQTATRFAERGNTHFLARPSSLAFGQPGTFATAQDEDQITQPTTPEDFMGPTLWTSDLDVFDGGHGGHLDMLHNSPNGAGIAWESENTYWIFDGYHGCITRYAFNGDHGAGGADHSDGTLQRYVEGEVSYVPDVASHMELDHERGLLYIADTGNGRVAVLDIESGEFGRRVFPNYDGTQQYHMEGTTLETLTDGGEMPLQSPSGLALRDGMVFVSDNATATIHAFDLESGERLDHLDLSEQIAPGALQGIAFDPAGRLYVVDSMGDRVLRVEPRE